MHNHIDPPRGNQRALAFLRISVGILFLIFGQYKVFGTQFTLNGGFEFWINKFLQDGAYPFMSPILRGVVLPHARPIAFLVAYGELAIGIALTLGVWVRRASVFGLLFMVTLLFASNYPGAGAPMWQYFGASLEHSVLGLCFVTFLIGESDAVWAVGGREEWAAVHGKKQEGGALRLGSGQASPSPTNTGVRWPFRYFGHLISASSTRTTFDGF